MAVLHCLSFVGLSPLGWGRWFLKFALVSKWAYLSATMACEPKVGPSVALWASLGRVGISLCQSCRTWLSKNFWALEWAVSFSSFSFWLVGLWLPAWSSYWEWDVAFFLDKLWWVASRSYLWNAFKWKLQKEVTLRCFQTQRVSPGEDPAPKMKSFQVGRTAPWWLNASTLQGNSRFDE